MEILCFVVGFLCGFDGSLCQDWCKGYQFRFGYGHPNDCYLIITWGIVCCERQIASIREVSTHTWLFLVLSGVATGLSWLFYFKALQTGDVSRVAPVDKLSVVMTICLSFLFLKEPTTPRVIIGALFITCGSILMLLK